MVIYERKIDNKSGYYMNNGITLGKCELYLMPKMYNEKGYKYEFTPNRFTVKVVNSYVQPTPVSYRGINSNPSYLFRTKKDMVEWIKKCLEIKMR